VQVQWNEATKKAPVMAGAFCCGIRLDGQLHYSIFDFPLSRRLEAKWQPVN
jgi:hypothetical protein